MVLLRERERGPRNSALSRGVCVTWFIVPYLWGEVSKDDRPVTRTGYRSAYFDRSTPQVDAGVTAAICPVFLALPSIRLRIWSAGKVFATLFD